MVPPRTFRSIPRFSAMAMYMAQTMAAGGLMVMEVVIWSMGSPANRSSMSFNVSMATPHLPHSPLALGESESYPIKVGMSKAVERPVWPSRTRR